MDIGATSHMMENEGNIMSYFNTSNNIIVGSDYHILVIGYRHVSLPTSSYSFNLHNVLLSTKLIKTLVSSRKFTIDNDVSVEFDPFGFSVKDFQIGMHLIRYNNSGDLYPLTTRPTLQPNQHLPFLYCLMKYGITV